MKNWRVKDRDGLDILLYKAKEGKIVYRLEHEDTKKSFDTWGIEIENPSRNIDEQFSVYLMFKVKHGPNYDNRVLQMAEARIKKLLAEVKP